MSSGLQDRTEIATKIIDGMGYERKDIPAVAVVSAKRSAIMASVGSKHTDLELALRRKLWARRVRYRVHLRVAGTSPDLSFIGPKVAVFVDGCFWHGCPRHYASPKTNVEFWKVKLDSNQNRDVRDRLKLEMAGWTVLRFWGCQIREDLDAVVAAIETAIGRRAAAILTTGSAAAET